MPRSTKEWIGKTPDEKIPDHVRLRIWRRQKGDQDHAVCPLSGLWLRDTDEKHLDHVKALIENGEHRESNLAFVHPIAHQKKTAAEVKRRADNDARAKSHAGITSDRRTGLEGPDRAGKDVRKARRSQERAPAGKPPVPGPRSLFREARQ